MDKGTFIVIAGWACCGTMIFARRLWLVLASMAAVLGLMAWGLLP